MIDKICIQNFLNILIKMEAQQKRYYAATSSTAHHDLGTIKRTLIELIVWIY
jgi:hypothetical protein